MTSKDTQINPLSNDPGLAKKGDILKNKHGKLFVVTACRSTWFYIKPKPKKLGEDESKESIRTQISLLKNAGWTRLTEKIA